MAKRAIVRAMSSEAKATNNLRIHFTSSQSSHWNPGTATTSNVTTSSSSPLRIGVLDSSFNPPTIAHLKLLTECAIAYRLDCYLLLISSHNADKGEVKRTTDSDDNKKESKLCDLGIDGGLEGRIEMMKHVAKEAQQVLSSASSTTCNSQPNTTSEQLLQSSHEIAVAETSHALFIDKATELSRHFTRPVDSYFILGMDTVVRLFNPKYYLDPVPQLTQFLSTSKLICAERAGSTTTTQTKAQISQQFKQEVFTKLVQDSLFPISLSDELQTVSSTAVRSHLKRLGELHTHTSSSIDQDHTYIQREREIEEVLTELRKSIPNSVLEFILEESLYLTQSHETSRATKA